MLQTMIGDQGLKTQLTYYLPFLKYHSRWSELDSCDFHTSPYLKGARVDFTVRELENPGIPQEAAGVPEINMTYLDKIIELCRENDAQLVLFAVPFGVETDDARYNRRQGLNLTLEQELEARDIPFLFYQRDDPELIDFSTDFRDRTHLNTAGAQKLTTRIGSWLCDTYGLTGHRGEASFASWDAEQEQYDAYLQSAMENPEDTADEK
jgi:hypothetical protein